MSSATKFLGSEEMTHYPLIVEETENTRPVQDYSDFDLSGEDVLKLLSMYDPYGVWRMDLTSGKVYWSKDVYEIHGLPYTKGEVDLTKAIKAYHPEDAKMVAQLLDEAIASKSSFRFVLRLSQPDGTYKMVKSSAKYRVSTDGKAEIIGLFSQFQLPVRSIASAKLL
jgi:hypothetical protein